MRRTKILATLGPACEDYDTIRAMVEAGLDGARLNFSHGTHQEHARLAELVREAAGDVGRPVALVQDLQGPKIRVREVQEGAVDLVEGSTISVDASQDLGTAEHLTVDDARVIEGAEPGGRVILGDGEVMLEVTEMHEDSFQAKVLEGGEVTTGAGITVRGLELPGGLTEKDQADLLVGRKMDVDYVAISFVADGVLVARGDLGIALPPEEVPVAQKRLLRMCASQGLLSITATQMLESMVQSPRPTRAEASDVANAILDGTHVVMLSGETAVGVNPTRAVATMAKIASETERAIVSGEMEETWRRGVPDGSQADAVAHAAASLAEELGVHAIVSFTASGSTARRVAKYRPSAPILGATPSRETFHRLALVWGVHPFMAPDADTLDELVWIAEDAAKAVGAVEPGDEIALTAGEIGVPGTTNLVRVATVR